MRPEQRGHSRTSRAQTRFINSDQNRSGMRSGGRPHGAAGTTASPGASPGTSPGASGSMVTTVSLAQTVWGIGPGRSAASVGTIKARNLAAPAKIPLYRTRWVLLTLQNERGRVPKVFPAAPILRRPNASSRSTRALKTIE